MVFAIVDNNQTDLILLSEGITATIPECQVEIFTDPLLSAKYICNNPVDLVLMAETMRPVNGFRLLQVLRKNIPNVPVIMLLSSGLHSTDAIHAGVNGYLVKPVTEEMLKRIEQEVRSLNH